MLHETKRVTNTLTSQDHRITRSQDHRITRSQDHKITGSQDHRITRTQDHTITRSQDHKNTRSQDHKTTRSQYHRITISQDHTITCRCLVARLYAFAAVADVSLACCLFAVVRLSGSSDAFDVLRSLALRNLRNDLCLRRLYSLGRSLVPSFAT